jgi:hypothetical protein
MTNSIKNISIWNQRLNPAEAEVAINVTPEHVFSMTQVRGRLVGPQCRYASTVEVAYALRETGREYASEGIPGIICQALIPEPSLWDPVSPFLYKGQIELLESGKQCEVVQITHCLRGLSLGRSGLCINGAALFLRGKSLLGPVSEADAISLHNQGINTLLVDVDNSTPNLWDMADRLGFVLLTRISNEQELKMALGRTREIRNRSFCNRSLCLGWLISPQAVENELALIAAQTLLSTPLLGLELTRTPSGPVPEGFTFVAYEESLAPSLAEIKIPSLLLTNREEAGELIVKKTWSPPVLLGWIGK